MSTILHRVCSSSTPAQRSARTLTNRTQHRPVVLTNCLNTTRICEKIAPASSGQASELRDGTTSRRVLLAAFTGLNLAIHTAKSACADEQRSPAAAIADSIRRDIVVGQSYITGDVTRELYAPEFMFKDPGVESKGIDTYIKAVQTLFDPTKSRIDLISLQVTSPTTLVARWRLEGALRLGGLKIKPYTGTTTYTISDSGKILRHEETWDISVVDSFVSTFIPSFGAPPAPPVIPAP